MQQPSPRRRPSSAHVPAAPFVRRLIAHINEDFMELLGEPYDGTPEQGGALQQYGVPNPVTVLLEKVWSEEDLETARRAFYNLRNGQEWIHFDLADRILCVLHQVDHWNIDTELAEIMAEVSLLNADVLRPTCDAGYEQAVERVRVQYACGGVKKTAAVTGVGAHTVRELTADLREPVAA